MPTNADSAAISISVMLCLFFFTASAVGGGGRKGNGKPLVESDAGVGEVGGLRLPLFYKSP